MNTKTSKFSFAVLLILLIAFGNAGAQTKIGIKAGVNFSNVTVKDENGDKAATQSMPGLLLGLTVDIPLSNDLYIQPAFQYAGKGFKQHTGGFYGSADNFRVNVSYIQVPVDFLYKPKLGAGNLILGAGPYIGYGTGGTWRSDNDIAIGDIITDDHGKAIFRNNLMDGEFGNYMYGKPVDYGANFLAGYEFFNKLSVQVNIQAGLANLEPEYNAQHSGSLRNTDLGFSVGYKF